MKRKLIKQGGGGGVTVYLPSKWIEKQRLKAGEEVDIEEGNNELIISTNIKKTKKEIVLKINDEYIKNLRYLLKQIYRQGNERIVLKYSSHKQFKQIESVIQEEFIGLEIIDHHKTQCVIESLVEVRKEKYEVFLRKMFQIINHTIEIIPEQGESNEIRKLTNKLSAYQNFGKLVVSNLRKGLIDYEHYSLLSYLLNIQADLAKLNSQIIKRKLKLSAETKSYLQETSKLFKDVETAFYKGDLDALNEINKYAHKKIQSVLDKKNRPQDFIILHYYLEILRLIYGAISPMTGIIINEKNH